MESVVAALARWGPGCDPPGVSRAAAEDYCRRLAASHYENFSVATWLLPPDLRQHFCNVYAFCRWADDLGDETGDPHRALSLLGWWRDELRRCFRGDVSHPVFVALRETITRFDLPMDPFADLISAFEQDQTVRAYPTFAQLLDYCRRSADPVGRILLHLGNSVREETVTWSDSLCTGLQLANFCQDVARDLDLGRVYLPAADRQQFGYTEEDLQQRRTNAAFVALMRFEVDRARDYLIAGQPLVAALPGRLRVDIQLFLSGGLQILTEIERIGYRVWERRPVISRSRKLWLLAAAVGNGLLRRGLVC
jgi:squalene synthase HpnC